MKWQDLVIVINVVVWGQGKQQGQGPTMGSLYGHPNLGRLPVAMQLVSGTCTASKGP